jgi:heat shock protein HslJ
MNKSLLLHATALMLLAWLLGGCAAEGEASAQASAKAPTGELPPGLRSPDSGVVCHDASATCYDRYGPSIGLTEAFLGREAAARLMQKLKQSPPDPASFSPAAGIICRWGSGPCRRGDAIQQPLSDALFNPAPRKAGYTAEQATIMEAEWAWCITRHEAQPDIVPPAASRYRIRLSKDGTLQVVADCNRAGGQFRMTGSTLSLRILHSTLAACPPGSLDTVFLQDLQRVSGFFLREGELHLELGGQAGTMQFERVREQLTE